MTEKISPSRRIISNILAEIMPTKKLRNRVRHAIRHPNSLKKRAYLDIKSQWDERGEKIIPARFDKYDLVFVVGASCEASFVLKNIGMRAFSNPLEWLAGAVKKESPSQYAGWRDTRFLQKIEALCKEFKDFFCFEDFRLADSHLINQHQRLTNTRYNIGWWHIFPDNQSWQQYFPTAQETIMRRAQRLITKIETSNRVLMIWAHRISVHKNILEAPVTDDEIIRAVQLLNKKWPNKDFDMVFFEHDGTKPRFEFDKIKVTDGAYRILSNHFDSSQDYSYIYQTVGERTAPLVMTEMLDNIKLSDRL